MAAQVKIAGNKGTVNVEVADGATVREVLIEAAQTLGLSNPTETVDRLAPVVDSAPSELDAPLPSTAQRVTAAPAVRNG
jgi:hypothetical protein